MARPRFQNADPAKQEAILQAAAKEFAKVGFEAASINRILESAGLSKGGFYYYFDDKADLAVTVLLWSIKDLLAIYDRLSLPSDPAAYWEMLTQFNQQSLEALERAPYTNELMSRLSHAFVSNQELAQRAIDVFAQPTSAMVKAMRHGQEIGAIRSDLSAELLMSVLQATKLALTRAFLPEGQVFSREKLESLTAIQMDLMRRICAPAEEKSR